MFARVPTVALLAATLALPALADEPSEAWLVSPQLTESSRIQATPATGAPGPFYPGFAAATVSDEAFWLFDGIDTPNDADPRDEQVLPRPVPALTFELR